MSTVPNQLSQRLVSGLLMSVTCTCLWATSGVLTMSGESEPSHKIHGATSSYTSRSQIDLNATQTKGNSSNERIIQTQTVSLPVVQQAYYYQENFAGRALFKYSADVNDYYYTIEGGQITEAYKKLENVITTAYTWLDGVGDPIVGDPKKTSTMTDAVRTYGIAADYKHLKLGTVLIVPGYGKYKVDDGCGRARRVGRGSTEALKQLDVPVEERPYTRILIDLRIPNLGSNGVWRSDDKILETARNHGVRKNVTILQRIWARYP